MNKQLSTKALSNIISILIFLNCCPSVYNGLVHAHISWILTSFFRLKYMLVFNRVGTVGEFLKTPKLKYAKWSMTLEECYPRCDSWIITYSRGNRRAKTWLFPSALSMDERIWNLFWSGYGGRSLERNRTWRFQW